MGKVNELIALKRSLNLYELEKRIVVLLKKLDKAYEKKFSKRKGLDVHLKTENSILNNNLNNLHDLVKDRQKNIENRQKNIKNIQKDIKNKKISIKRRCYYDYNKL